jgi:hypothetical protein
VQVVIKLLNPLHKLPDWHPVGLLQPIAYVKALGRSRITPENQEQVKGHAIHKGLPRPVMLFSVFDSK